MGHTRYHPTGCRATGNFGHPMWRYRIVGIENQRDLNKPKDKENIIKWEKVDSEENQTDQSATFLDLDIHIINGEFDYKLYDKRNGFQVRYKNFKIVRFPFRSSNMPNKMFYSTISAEILRICRATKHFQNFKIAVTQFLERMKAQGGIKEGVKGSISKLLKRHKVSFTKFNMPTNAILSFVVEHL